jgi:hypothetical protein
MIEELKMWKFDDNYGKEEEMIVVMMKCLK